SPERALACGDRARSYRRVRRLRARLRTPARNHAAVSSCLGPLQLTPADIAAVEAVGEVDLIERAIGARAGIGEVVGDGGDGEHAATLCDKVAVFERRAGMEDGYSRHLLGHVDVADCRAVLRRAGITLGGEDHGQRMLLREARGRRIR